MNVSQPLAIRNTVHRMIIKVHNTEFQKQAAIFFFFLRVVREEKMLIYMVIFLFLHLTQNIKICKHLRFIQPGFYQLHSLVMLTPYPIPTPNTQYTQNNNIVFLLYILKHMRLTYYRSTTSQASVNHYSRSCKTTSHLHRIRDNNCGALIAFHALIVPTVSP